MYEKIKLTNFIFQPVFKFYKFQLYSKVAYAIQLYFSSFNSYSYNLI